MPAVDFALVQIEESPLSERTFGLGATPNRVATEKLYVPHTAFGLKPNPAYVDRADEQRAILGAVPKLLESYAPSGSYSERCYLDDITWWLYLVGFTPVHTAGGALVTDGDQTTATGVNALNSAVVNVADTSLFPAAGTFIMLATAVTYTGKTATSFTGCSNHPATVGGEAVNGNVPVGAHKWVWTKRSGINAQTAQIILNYADEAVRLQGNGFAISDLSISGDGVDPVEPARPPAAAARRRRRDRPLLHDAGRAPRSAAATSSSPGSRAAAPSTTSASRSPTASTRAGRCRCCRRRTSPT
jgi:hypothetical protein